MNMNDMIAQLPRVSLDRTGIVSESLQLVPIPFINSVNFSSKLAEKE